MIHHPECWREHHACAVIRIEQLTKALDAEHGKLALMQQSYEQQLAELQATLNETTAAAKRCQDNAQFYMSLFQQAQNTRR